MKTQLLRDLQANIDLNSDWITLEQKRRIDLKNQRKNEPLDDERLWRLDANQRLAKKVMKRMLENLVSYMENNSK